MKFKPVKPVDRDKNGTLVIHLAADEANDDWIRAARLARKAEAGDEEAAEALKRLHESPMGHFIEDDETD